MEENTAVSKSTDWSAPSWDSELNANSRESVSLGADDAQEVEEVEEVLSLQDSEKELIRRALSKHRNRRKYAALELGISERTLYRKIKEYGLK
jgi:transcriptional regulator with PAS, ATPase and Fis domain